MRLIDADYVTEKLNEINGTAELDKAFEIVENAPTVDVLEQIRNEIEHLTYYWCEINPKSVIDDVLQIIDKYKEQTE